MSDFTFELARSRDMTKIGELTQARNRSLALTLNNAGAFNMALPLTDDLAYEVREVETCVIISMFDETVWSGPVWTCQESITANDATLQVGCVGWLQTLDKRIVRASWNAGSSTTYADVDAGAIAQDLVLRTNEDASSAGAPNYVFPGSSEATQARTRTYAPWSVILPGIKELSEIEAGYDMLVDPVTRELNIYAQLKRDRGVQFELGNNVQNVSRQVDGGSTKNYFTAYSNIGAVYDVNMASLTRLGLFEESASLSDVVNVGILDAFAGSTVAVYGWPLPMINFTPMPYSPERDDQPRVFQDYNLGDIVQLTARKGRLRLDHQAVRIFAFSVDFQDTGYEQVTGIQTTAGGG